MGKNAHAPSPGYGALTVLNQWRGADKNPERVSASSPPDALKSPPPPVRRLVGRRVFEAKPGGGA